MAPDREEQQPALEAEGRKEPLARQAPLQTERRIVGSDAGSKAPQEVLVVMSKLKAHIRAQSGMNTSDGVADVLSDHLRRLSDRAAENAATDGRKTVLDRDFRALLTRSS